ncbi:hypothetical protein IE81DRAFT_321750 [Ceraceosorus guamensis]|uniref:Uncharacterized protein n=1 Tax=Ceraceosorus guamensis TaxID=1522189 RepID=A0A316W2G6_9BASI|nr:hypothetical protein IE81DRAFT_321750 [Ceraceosorus guamensis]PWN44087.1 hypothetical protein IE81DRAFT_321750 [Ceraceosorus guamensis]
MLAYCELHLGPRLRVRCASANERGRCACCACSSLCHACWPLKEHHKYGHHAPRTESTILSPTQQSSKAWKASQIFTEQRTHSQRGVHKPTGTYSRLWQASLGSQ